MSSLQTAIKAISGKATLPVLEGALLEAFDGMLRITCTDLNMGIVTQLEADIAEEGRVVLPGKLLGEIVRKLPVGDVDVSVAPNNAATIRCRGSRTTLAGFAAAILCTAIPALLFGAWRLRRWHLLVPAALGLAVAAWMNVSAGLAASRGASCSRSRLRCRKGARGRTRRLPWAG